MCGLRPKNFCQNGKWMVFSLALCCLVDWIIALSHGNKEKNNNTYCPFLYLINFNGILQEDNAQPYRARNITE